MEDKKPDIFDRIMHLPGFRIFEGFYKKHKEVLMYLFFGGLTTIVSIASYAIFLVMGINVLIANVMSWVFAVLFAFFTNRIWVFEATTDSVSDFFKQLISFASGRVVTLGIEELIILIFDTILKFPSIWVKFVAQIVVIVLNYVISKLVVFRKK